MTVFGDNNMVVQFTPDQYGRGRALMDVSAERDRQVEKWGEQEHSELEWLAILTEEVGETAQEVLTRVFGSDGNGHGDLRGEIVHVAAVAVAWLEDLDR